MRREAGREPPWRHIAAQFLNSLFTVDVDEINGELHPERVYRLAGNDPEPTARRQTLSAKKPLAARGACASLFQTSCENGVTSEVADEETNLNGWLGIENHFDSSPFLLDWRYEPQPSGLHPPCEAQSRVESSQQSMKGASDAPFMPRSQSRTFLRPRAQAS